MGSDYSHHKLFHFGFCYNVQKVHLRKQTDFFNDVMKQSFIYFRRHEAVEPVRGPATQSSTSATAVYPLFSVPHHILYPLLSPVRCLGISKLGSGFFLQLVAVIVAGGQPSARCPFFCCQYLVTGVVAVEVRVHNVPCGTAVGNCVSGPCVSCHLSLLPYHM